MTYNWLEHLETLQRMADEGESISSIAKSFGLSRERVRQVFKKYGLKPSSNPKRQTTNRPTHYNKKT
jgi:hypothetical protein